jgi:hypothetical protein
MAMDAASNAIVAAEAPTMDVEELQAQLEQVSDHEFPGTTATC